MNFQLLVFDFDGLIMDTETPDYASWNEVYAAHGAELPMDVWCAAVGTRAGTFHPTRHLEQLIGQPLDHDGLAERRLVRFHEMVEELTLLPGVAELIEDAKSAGWKVAVASSADRPWVHGHLQKQGLFAHFDAVRTFDDVERAKPAPDLYLSVLEALGVPAHEAIALEDSPPGMHAAKAAGMYGVAVPNSITRHYDLSHADAVVETLAGLTARGLAERVLARP